MVEKEDIAKIEKEVHEIKGRVTELSKQREQLFWEGEKHIAEFEEMQKMVGDIHKAIIGNEPLGHTGVIKELNLLKKRVEQLEAIIDRLNVVIAKIGAIGGVIGAVIGVLLTLLFKLFT